jgi:hypothetical protein
MGSKTGHQQHGQAHGQSDHGQTAIPDLSLGSEAPTPRIKLLSGNRLPGDLRSIHINGRVRGRIHGRGFAEACAVRRSEKMN